MPTSKTSASSSSSSKKKGSKTSNTAAASSSSSYKKNDNKSDSKGKNFKCSACGTFYRTMDEVAACRNKHNKDTFGRNRKSFKPTRSPGNKVKK